jgi:hypothetical protein
MNLNKDFLVEALNELNAPWLSIENNNYDLIKWKNDLSVPTKQEVEDKIKELKLLEPLKRLREERDKKLLETDKYSITDWPHPTEEIKQAWITYRQQLRDLPTNTDSIKDMELDEYDELIGVVWPTPPEF